MAKSKGTWIDELQVGITVADENGVIIEMNEKSLATFAKYGGADLIGKNVFDLHPEHAKPKVKQLYETQTPNHYTIRKDGQKKIIHQLPWYEDGVFAGFVEISIPIPDDIPHFERP